jgi:hypothetical protein
MKKTVFSPRIFLFTLRLNWLPFVIVAAGAGILGSLFGGLFYGLGFGDSVNVFNIADVGAILRYLPLALIPLTVRSFIFYTRRCESDFYESLPYTRTQILVSVSAATALLALGMLIVSAATSLIVFMEALKGSIFLIGESLESTLCSVGCNVGSFCSFFSAVFFFEKLTENSERNCRFGCCT